MDNENIIMGRSIDFLFIGLNSTLAFIGFEHITPEGWALTLNILSAFCGFLWLFVERLPRAIYYINKAWLGILATIRGEKLDKEEYLIKHKDEDESNED